MENLKLKNHAILIADAHENTNRRGFLKFLNALSEDLSKNLALKCPQLILMGDIFDVLVGEISPSHRFAMPYINLLESLANAGLEIIYIEGNHDFNLSSLFKNVKIFTLSNQPIFLQTPPNFSLKKICFCAKNSAKNQALKIKNSSKNAVKFLPKPRQEIYKFSEISGLNLAHGDNFLSPFLAFLLRNLRNHFLLKILNFANKIARNFFYKKLINHQKNKNLFYDIPNFHTLIKKRRIKYEQNLGQNSNLIIEGHYHQGVVFEDLNYVNLPSFANKGEFFVIEFE